MNQNLDIFSVDFTKYKVSLDTSQVAYQAGAYPSFCSMKQLGVFLLSPGWDASPSQGYPPALNFPLPIIHLGGERHRKSKGSCPRTQWYPSTNSSLQISIFQIHQIFKFSYFPHFNTYPLRKNISFPKCPKITQKFTQNRQTVVNEISREI